MVRKIIRDNSVNSEVVAEVQKMTKIPVSTTDNELRRFMEGKFSMFNNIPIPRVNVTDSGDCYLLPSDVFWLFFALGVLDPHLIRTEADIPNGDKGVYCAWQTKKAKSLLSSVVEEECSGSSCYKALLAEWSDGMDPNGKTLGSGRR